MKKYILLLIVAVTTFSSCAEWLDINRNPNSPEIDLISSDLILSACEYDMISNHINSTYAVSLAQHMTKSGEFSGNYTFLNGLIMPQNLDSWWTTYYKINTNLEIIRKKAIEDESNIYKGMSLTLMAINWQRMVDIWGDIPYTEAGDAINFPNPKYDDAATIYADLLSKLDEAIAAFQADIESGIAPNKVLAGADIIGAGDPNTWIKIASSVKLRLLMRLSGVQDVKSQVAALVSAGNLLSGEDIVEGNPGYYVASGKLNIFYQTYGWDFQGNPTTNFRQYMPTSTMVDMLRNNDDPRLRVFANPRTKIGQPVDGADYEKFGLEDEYYIGIPYGQDSPPAMTHTSTTGIGLLVGGTDFAEGSIRSSLFMTGAESDLLLAEAALEGIISGDAQMYYERAVTSNFVRHEMALKAPSSDFPAEYAANMLPAIEGTADEAAAAYLSQDNVFSNWEMMNDDQKKEAIGVQKWLNFYGYNPMEAWFEQRRTEFPRLKASNQAQENKLLSILPYPQSEYNLNADNTPAQADRDFYNSLVFWDKVNPTVERNELYF